MDIDQGPLHGKINDLGLTNLSSLQIMQAKIEQGDNIYDAYASLSDGQRHDIVTKVPTELEAYELMVSVVKYLSSLRYFDSKQTSLLKECLESLKGNQNNIKLDPEFTEALVNIIKIPFPNTIRNPTFEILLDPIALVLNKSSISPDLITATSQHLAYCLNRDRPGSLHVAALNKLFRSKNLIAVLEIFSDFEESLKILQIRESSFSNNTLNDVTEGLVAIATKVDSAKLAELFIRKKDKLIRTIPDTVLNHIIKRGIIDSSLSSGDLRTAVLSYLESLTDSKLSETLQKLKNLIGSKRDFPDTYSVGSSEYPRATRAIEKFRNSF
jgi:hypothetical protein